MKRLVLTSLIAASFQAGAVVLTFDDIPGGSIQDSYGDMPTYKGFSFNMTLDWVDSVGATDPSWNRGAISGDFTLLNNMGGTGIIRASDLSDFTFDGVWAATYASFPWGPKFYVRGFKDGAEIWNTSIDLVTSYTYIAGMTGAIDELRIGGWHIFNLDNLALNEASSVPEPGSLALVALGLVGCFARRGTSTRTEAKLLA